VVETKLPIVATSGGSSGIRNRASFMSLFQGPTSSIFANEDTAVLQVSHRAMRVIAGYTIIYSPDPTSIFY